MGASRKRLAAAPAEVAWHAHIPRRDVVIGCAGLAALLAVIPGWSEHSLSVKWKLAHSSRGGLGSARWPRTVARPAFVGRDRVALPWMGCRAIMSSSHRAIMSSSHELASCGHLHRMLLYCNGQTLRSALEIFFI